MVHNWNKEKKKEDLFYIYYLIFLFKDGGSSKSSLY